MIGPRAAYARGNTSISGKTIGLAIVYLVMGAVVIHVEHLVADADIARCHDGKLQAPLHEQASRLKRQRYVLHAAVASFAADAFGDMDAVIEVSELRKLIDAVPLDGRVGLPTGPHRLGDGGIGPDLRMSGHAGLGGRQAGDRVFLDGGVAVAAIQPQVAHMVLVAERHRLLDGDFLMGCIAGRGPKRPRRCPGR